jgi:two-component system, cell cycle response regulator
MNPPASNYEILVVDDSPIYRKLVEQILSSQPFSLLFASNGQEAQQLFRQHSPCLVITDWIMPDLSGLELCKQIRADHSESYTYLIVMTSSAEKGNVVKALEAGADDYLTKPFDPGEMLARIGVGCRIIDLNRELAAKRLELEQVARTDSLTELPNRRALEDWAARQLRGSVRHGFPFWVVLGDIDCFKSINDSFGHDSGDLVLKTFAGLLKKNIRASDMCGRLGGDEFLMVLTHVPAKNIEMTINRFREQFASLAFSFKEQNVRVTASFGACGTTGNDLQEFAALIRQADQMLYEAKRAGRNLVRVAFP